MDKEINKLNDLYRPVLKMIKLLEKYLNDSNIKYKLGFYNNHEIKINGKFIKEIYPIPVITCKINDIETDIGIDLVNNNQYLGFIELTLSKNKIIKFNFDILKDYDFEIYGLDNFLEDYYFGDIYKTKELISKSMEKNFHIGINIINLNQVKNLIKILENK